MTTLQAVAELRKLRATYRRRAAGVRSWRYDADLANQARAEAYDRAVEALGIAITTMLETVK